MILWPYCSGITGVSTPGTCLPGLSQDTKLILTPPPPPAKQQIFAALFQSAALGLDWARMCCARFTREESGSVLVLTEKWEHVNIMELITITITGQVSGQDEECSNNNKCPPHQKYPSSSWTLGPPIDTTFPQSNNFFINSILIHKWTLDTLDF